MVRVIELGQSLWFAIPLGVLLGLGLWTLLALLPRFGAPRLSLRLAPYLTDISPAARRLLDDRRVEPAGALLVTLEPLADRARRGIAALLGGDDGVARRLRQAGDSSEVRRFRSRQLLATALGLAVGVVGAALAHRQGTLPPSLIPALVLAGGAAGLLLPEQLLARRARRRQQRIADELPTVLDFLSIALAAGEGVADALARAARSGNGELARELSRIVAETHSGVSLAVALTRGAEALALPTLTRTVDQLVGALERGAPLAEVLRVQAADARDESRRQLLESAGKKEVGMMVPLVLLILPVTVAFALAPASLVLELTR